MITVVSTVPHPSVVKEVICMSCGATLQYVPKDVVSVQHTDYGGGTDTYRHIICPPCGSQVHVR